MTTKRRFLQTTKLATAAFLATGMAVSPLALNGLNGVAAQPAASTGGEGAAKEFVEGSESSGIVDDETTMKSTADDVTRDSTMDMDSTTDDMTMESTTDEMMTEPFTHTAAYDDYEAAMTDGNLESAASALADATDRPITEDFVLEVNRELGIESTLPAQQVATAASEKQNVQQEDEY